MEDQQTNFRPQSIDATLARILERLDQQDKVSIDYRNTIYSELKSIRGTVEATNNRVTSLENDKIRLAGAVTALSLAISVAWQWFINKKG